MAVHKLLSDDFRSHRRLVEEIAASGVPAAAVDIYRGRNRVVRLDTPTGPVNIKAFRIPNALNRVVYGNLRRSKARRSYENARRLLALGFPTPAPIAWIELTSRRLMGRSYYLSVQEEDVQDIRRIGSSPLRARLTDGIGALMAALHSARVWMKDFSGGNILWRVSPSGEIEYFLVDINRMAFGVTSRRRLMKNFRAVSEDPEVLDEIARAYARHSGLDEAATVTEARKVRADFLRRHAMRDRLRHRLPIV